MVTVYGPRSTAEAMIAEVRRLHERVRGTTPAGEPYHANDPELLNWVQATAAFGFAGAYHAYVAPLSAADRNRYYNEGQPSAALYGATGAPASEAEVSALFESMRGRLEPSPVLFEFLDIVRKAPVLPMPLRLAQPLFVAAAVSLTPAWTRKSSHYRTPSACAAGRRSWSIERGRRRTGSCCNRALRCSPACAWASPPITSMAARRAAKRAPKATGSRFEDAGWQLQNFVRRPFARLDWSCLCSRCSSFRRNDGDGGEGTFPRFGPRFPRFERSAAANLDRLRIAIERIGPRYPRFERPRCMLRLPHSGDPFVRRSRFVWQPGRPRIARPAAANLDRLQIAIERGYGGEG